MLKETKYKKKIKENLYNYIDSGFIPELGVHKSGKVRDVHFSSKQIIMVSSDRISCFDQTLKRKIPFKGNILNQFANWAFEKTSDLVPNALLESPHPNVIIQKTMNKIEFEFVVRGYVWGSMAQNYEDGKREFCGIELSDKLLRYQKLDEPIFTPATKEENGEHDINVSFNYMVDKIGIKLSDKLRVISIKLFQRAAKLAKERGFIFIDTKYEFGLDENGNVYLIDEANTPDSSRYCSIREYEKFKQIKIEMQTGKYKSVTKLLKNKPKFKIKELSKQFARDVLQEKGFSYGSSGNVPQLTDEDVIEISYRYINLYEELTGKTFQFPVGNVKRLMIEKLKNGLYIKGGLVVIIAGSDSDKPHIDKIIKQLNKYNIATIIRICSAHKQPGKCEKMLNKYNTSLEPIVIVAVAGGIDALSGVASFISIHPVISCPPNQDNYFSSIANPPGSSNSLILNPTNVAKHIAKILGQTNSNLKKFIRKKNKAKIEKLEKADQKLI